jgi:hypothetical protein
MKMPQPGVDGAPLDGAIQARNQCLALARFKCSEQGLEFRQS